MSLRVLVLGGAMSATGAVISCLALSAYWQLHAAMGWAAIPAEVISSHVETWSGSKGTSYYPHVRYQYSVAGTTHLGDTIKFGPAVVSRREAEADVLKFGAGTKTIVFVDPADPEQSVLDRDSVSGAIVWQLGCGVFLLAGGIFMALAALRLVPDRLSYRNT